VSTQCTFSAKANCSHISILLSLAFYLSATPLAMKQLTLRIVPHPLWFKLYFSFTIFLFPQKFLRCGMDFDYTIGFCS
jgi:hypothetical protein